MNSPLRGDVFRANLNPIEGSEQGGDSRPVLIVSRDALNAHSPVVIVVPCTDASNKRRIYPSHVPVVSGVGGLTLDSVFLCEQIRTISKTRLVKHMGKIDRTVMTKIEAAMKIVLDL